ncbi:MAG: magnesium transporter [Planctomycetota bacterium]|jgi:magnesium transporter
MPDEKKQLSQQILLQQVELLLETQDKATLGQLLTELRTSELAEIVELVDNDHRRIIFDVIDKPASAEVLEKVDEATRAELFELLEDREIARIVSELDPDDAADVLQELPVEESEEVLESIPPAESAEIRRLMKYSEDSAGGIMDPLVINVPESATVIEAVNKIRAAEIDEDFYSVFVVDNNGKFIGDVRIRLLLTRPENKRISELVDKDTIFVSVEDDQEKVRNIFRDNDLIVVPVLDTEHKLVGRITADRIIEVADEEAAEDIYAMAGTDPSELESESVFRAARVRMTWLLPCLFGTAITAMLGLYFKNVFFNIELLPIFTVAFAFVPMIAAISGNAGLQTSAIVVSGLAGGHLADLRLREVFQREVPIALLVAVCCALLGALANAVLPNFFSGEIQPIDWAIHLRIVTAFGVGMFAAIIVSTSLGLVLPFIFRRVGIDPAISSGPLVTTANDSISVAIYMTLTLLLVRQYIT